MIEEQFPAPASPGTEAAILIGKEKQALSRALQYAGQYDNMPGANTYEYYGEMYGAVAAAYATEGQLDFAETYLEQHVPKRLETYGEAKSELARIRAASGDFAGASLYVREIDNEAIRDKARSKAATAMAEAGDVFSAVEMADGMTHPHDRLVLKMRLAQKDGPDSFLWEDVQRAMDEMPLGPKLEDLRTEQGTLLARSGNLAAAYEVRDSMKWNYGIQKIEREIAIAEGPESKLWSRLERAADRMKSSDDRETLLADLALGYAEIGQRERAINFANQTVRSEEVLMEVCNKLEDYDGVFAAADTIRQPGEYYYQVEETLIDVARKQAAKGSWVAAERTISKLYDKASRARAYAHVAEAMDKQAASLDVMYDEATPEAVLEMPLPKPAAVKHVGAHAIEHWRSFKRFDSTTFSRLAHGAARIANTYMTDDERNEFVRMLGSEFTRFRKDGMFEGGKHQAVLKNLSEALVEVGDAGTTSVMLETLYANMGEATGLRLIKTLVESGNAKAGAAGIALMADEDTPNHAYQYLLHKLAATGYLDRELPETILGAQHAGFPAAASRRLFQRYFQEAGIQLDSDLLEWTGQKMYATKEFLQRVTPGQVMASLDQNLDEILERVRSSRSKFDSLSQSQLLDLISSSPDDQAIYYILHGGRTQYSLIKHYNLTKFSASVAKAAEIDEFVDEDLVRKDLWRQAPFGWQESMQDRRRPDDSLVWELKVGSKDEDLRHAARREMRDVLGRQLTWILGGGGDAKNFADMPDQPAGLSEDMQKKLNMLFGEQISAVIRGEDRDVTVGDFEKVKNGMLAGLRQLRLLSKQHQDSLHPQWKSLIEQAETEDPILAMRHMVALITKDPSRSLRPQGATAEWIGHLHGLTTSVRESQRKGADNRTLTIRYLDGKEDFAELLRFADGAQCCFTSEDTIGTMMDETGEWRMRINRDPHWFVFSIEDTPPNADKRVSSGFIFGSVAEMDGEPALALNGVYMQRKTDEAANAILDDVIEKFAKPMGVRSVVIATQYGGDFAIDKSKWEPAAGHTLFRPRAIRSPRNIRTGDGGQPEIMTYDDLGSKVNQEAVLEDRAWRRIVKR